MMTNERLIAELEQYDTRRDELTRDHERQLLELTRWVVRVESAPHKVSRHFAAKISRCEAPPAFQESIFRLKFK